MPVRALKIMEHITDNIYLIAIPLPFPVTPELSMYYIDGEQPALVDTGLGDPSSMKVLTAALEEENRSLTDIRVLLITHEHIEHFGGNKKIKEASSAFSVASTRAADSIENYHHYLRNIKENVDTIPEEFAAIVNRFIEFNLSIDSSMIEHKVDDGASIDLGDTKLRAILTPGHADGHICLYDEERKILYSGDQVIATGTTFVGYGWRELAAKRIEEIFSHNEKPDRLSLYLESLEHLLTLDLDLILPGHGPPIREPYEKLRDDIRKKLQREERFLSVLEQRDDISFAELTAMAYDDTKSSFIQQGAALGYLERLSKRREIETRMGNGTLYIRRSR